MDADLTPSSQGRKLASIVSIDIVGYSRLAETDDAAALAAVEAVRARIERACAAHAGRLFSSAGDGFMLEFPTATGALTAAEEIAADSEPAVRIGVHLGEAFVTAGGDMLGHGVNVAARLQRIAKPGTVLASADVKRAVGGALSARLVPRGVVRLDKMEETLPIFELAATAIAPRRRWRIDRRLAFGGIGAAALIAVLAFMLLNREAPPQARVAVLAFRTVVEDSAAQSFADGLSDRIVGALSTRRILTVSPGDAATLRGAKGDSRRRQLGIDLVLDGGLQRAEENLTVDARLEDRRSRSVIWSMTLQGEAAQADTLQARVASRVVAEMYCGERALGRGNGLSDPAALAAYMRACDLFLVHSDDSQVVYELLAALRTVISLAPRFSPAHSDMAKYEAYFLDQFPADQVPSVRHEIEAEAHRALQLDPHNADAYVALYLLIPQGQWAEQERVLRQGLSVDPDWPHANGFLGNVFTEVGRLREASFHYQRAAAANPLSGGLSWSGQSAIRLANVGRADLADRAVADIARLWSDDDLDTWRVRIDIVFAERRWDEGLALLENAGAIPQWITPADIAAFRSFFSAAKSGRRGEIEAEWRTLLAMHRNSVFVVRALTALGFTDDAFALIDRMSDDQLVASNLPYYLFTPVLAALRADPRFMRVAARLGLIAYWRASDAQPDFCSERTLPYNCETEESRALNEH